MPLCPIGPLACLALAFTQTARPLVEINEPHGMSPLFLDRTVQPTVNFYRFANGTWLDNIQIAPSESQTSASSQARQKNAGIMQQIICSTSLNPNVEMGSIEQIVGTFYRVGMDRNLAEQLGARPVEPELARIQAIETRRDVMAELGKLHRWSVFAGFSARFQMDPSDATHRLICLGTGNLSLTRPEWYAASGPKGLEYQSHLRRTVEQMFRLLGDSADTLASSAASVVSIESKLARAIGIVGGAKPLSEPVGKMKMWQLGAAVPKVDWWIYFDHLGLPLPKSVTVDNPSYLATFGDILQSATISDLKNYLRWTLISASTPYLSRPFRECLFDLQRTLNGQSEIESREQFVLSQTDVCLSPELGQLLIRTQYGVSSQEPALAMVSRIREALRSSISDAAWLSPDAKSKALDKLNQIHVSVGYPDRWRKTEGLVMKSDSFWSNAFRTREFEFQRSLNALANPVDRTEWNCSPYRVDAFYSASLNHLILPAGILQPPYFTVEGDQASNYGSLGAVVGHEFMHAFDDEGRKIDAEGNQNDWWSPTDEKRFRQFEGSMVSQFDGYQATPRQHISGLRTLAENIADLGGLQLAYKAFQHQESMHPSSTIAGLTPEQRFFVAFGQIHRSKIRPEQMQLGLEHDPHSPPEYRVKGALQNVPEFWKAFHVPNPVGMHPIW